MPAARLALLACAGLVGLQLLGPAAPPPLAAALMLGGHRLGRLFPARQGAEDPLLVTAGNFVRAAGLGLLLGAAAWRHATCDAAGLPYAIASGALASGVGYAIWYAALPFLRAATAATVRLSVPVITAVGGVLLLGEAPTPRLRLASVAILGGIALVVWVRPAGAR